MAAKEVFCDPCSEIKSTVAVKYSSDCEEHLCEVCAESHLRFKAFRSHHLIDLSSAGFRLPSSANMNCEIHTDVKLDFCCIHHDTVCCRSCIPDCHSTCKQVYPLEFASKNVRNSALLADTFNDLWNISETLEKLLTSREVNIKLLAQSKSSIIQQIREVKEQILKKLDVIEQSLIAEQAVVEEKNISTMTNEKAEISKLDSLLKSNIEELEFLNEHGSNNQLFLALQKQISQTQKSEVKVQEIVSSIQETDIKFKGNITLECIPKVSILEITRPCHIKYTTYKSKQAQVQPEVVKSQTEFKRDGTVPLQSGKKYDIRGIAVTAENKLLICNYAVSKVYIYKDCKTFENEITSSSLPYDVAVIPFSNTAVVTHTHENAVEFINTANNTKERKVRIRETCFGVTATKERIYLGGNGKILILDTDGSEISTITTRGSWICSLHCDENKHQILIREDGKLRCIDLNGKDIYQYTKSGYLGLVVDRRGDVYVSGRDSNDIHRLSSDGTFRDKVLKESDGIERPRFLSFSHDYTKLFVVSNDKSVLIYNCK